MPSSRRSIAAGFLAIAVAMAGSRAWGQTYTWLGGSGSWSDAALWNTGTVPVGATVWIDGGKAASSAVILDVNPYLLGLTVDAGDSLRIGAGRVLNVDGTLSVNGTVNFDTATVAPPTYLYTTGGLTFTGAGRVLFGGGPVNLVNVLSYGPVVVDKGVSLSGPFNCVGDNGANFFNRGAVSVDGAGNVITIGSERTTRPDDNTGILSATGGAGMTLYYFENSSGGIINVTGATCAVYWFTNAAGATVNVSAGGTLWVRSAILDPGNLAGGGHFTNVGTLNLTDATLRYDLDASGRPGPASTLDVADVLATATITRSTVRLTGGFDNRGITLTVPDTAVLEYDGSYHRDASGLTGALGRLTGGVVRTAGTGRFVATAPSPSFNTLDGVLLDGNAEVTNGYLLDVTIGASGSARLAGTIDTHRDAATITPLTVLHGGRLSGTPASLTANVVSAGTIAPGNSVGTLPVNGNVTVQAGGHLEAELGPGGTADRLAVTGILDLSSADDYLDLIAVGSSPGVPYVVATAGSVSGTFDHVTPGYDVQYTPTSVIVVPVPEPVSLAGVIPVAVPCLLGRRRRRFAV